MKLGFAIGIFVGISVALLAPHIKNKAAQTQEDERRALVIHGGQHVIDAIYRAPAAPKRLPKIQYAEGDETVILFPGTKKERDAWRRRG